MTDPNNAIELSASLASMVITLMIEVGPKLAVIETVLKALALVDPENGGMLRSLQEQLAVSRLLVGPAATDAALRIAAAQMVFPDADQ